MSGLVVTKMHHLAGEFEDLKGRLRIALAGELARHVATAIGDVIRAVVAGEMIPHVQRTQFDRREVDADPWAESEEDSLEPESYRYATRSHEPEQSDPDLPPNVNASVAVAASVYVARWWILGRRGTLLGAVGPAWAFACSVWSVDHLLAPFSSSWPRPATCSAFPTSSAPVRTDSSKPDRLGGILHVAEDLVFLSDSIPQP